MRSIFFTTSLLSLLTITNASADINKNSKTEDFMTQKVAMEKSEFNHQKSFNWGNVETPILNWEGRSYLMGNPFQEEKLNFGSITYLLLLTYADKAIKTDEPLPKPIYSYELFAQGQGLHIFVGDDWIAYNGMKATLTQKDAALLYTYSKKRTEGKAVDDSYVDEYRTKQLAMKPADFESIETARQRILTQHPALIKRALNHPELETPKVSKTKNRKENLT